MKKRLSHEKREDKLHKKEERLHKRAERVEKEDAKVHREIKKIHKKEDRRPKKHHVSLKNKKEHKIEKVMREFKHGKLHSGSKKGPEVTNPKQAIAIALSEAKRLKKGRK